MRSSNRRRRGWVRLLLHVGRRALSRLTAIVLLTDLFEKLPGGMQLHLKLLRPGFREQLGIVDQDLIGHCCRIDIPQAFDGMESVAMPLVAGCQGPFA